MPIDVGGARPVADRACIVIPAYNEAHTISGLVRDCLTLEGITRVFVVDDGSRDDTARLAAEAGATVLRHPTNLGKGASLLYGMTAAIEAGADHIVTLDGDGQHRPADVPRLLSCAARWPARVVVGSRRASSDAAPRARARANRIADFWISWAARHPIDDSQSGFRVYPAILVHALRSRSIRERGFAFESELLIEAAHLGFSTVATDIPTIYGEAQKRPSHFRPVADITRIVLMVAGKLLRTWMDPIGLWRVLTLPRSRCDD
jgi:glycosyltransferase involved in cell wall biosynthesis